MTEPAQLPATTTTRPVLVTVAVVLWLVVAVVGAVRTAASVLVSVGTDGPWIVVPGVVTVAVWVALAWGATRLARGSARARFWLAVFGALAFLSAAAPPYGLNTVNGGLLGAAALLPYLPASRPFFPRTLRPVRPEERRVVAWDPETGEPIRERD